MCKRKSSAETPSPTGECAHLHTCTPAHPHTRTPQALQLTALLCTESTWPPAERAWVEGRFGEHKKGYTCEQRV